MDREELPAILCHELDHCAGRHHGFGALAVRTSRNLRDVGEALPDAMTVTAVACGTGGAPRSVPPARSAPAQRGLGRLPELP
ncbi:MULTISPECIES: hypothetical protein [unclassified Streptomyces]|uniref:hypothetical protein n=1 Tax=unclassified Streptomyces TaxID=2593676 RepID=UPI00036CCCD0|nr:MULTISPECIES: hypothetical protein [unclassified Streptomyces]MYY05221.1 hypothetical protein [Streptomyces sp. SID4913]